MKLNFSETYKNTAVYIFSPLVDRYINSFEGLKPHLMSSGMQILLKAWVSIIFLSVTLTYFASFLLIEIINTFFMLDLFFLLYLLVFVPILSAAFCFLLFYTYPVEKSRAIEKSIEINLPFALAHMSAIASSGIPPEFMFSMLTEFKEYGAISKQAKQIVHDITVLGMPSISAMNHVAKRCPSKTFRQMLQGMSSTIEKGGNLVEYLRVMSDKALFEYRLKREEYLKTLSTYADLYTGLLVAAPLMMLSILGVMGIIGGEVLGLSITDLITLITWVGLPFLNVVFLVFIHVTYPGV